MNTVQLTFSHSVALLHVKLHPIKCEWPKNTVKVDHKAVKGIKQML